MAGIYRVVSASRSVNARPDGLCRCIKAARFVTIVVGGVAGRLMSIDTIGFAQVPYGVA